MSLNLDKLITPGDTVMQVGFHFDKTSGSSQIIRFADAVGDTGTVIGIEPHPKSIEDLDRIVKQNKYKCNFITVNKATNSMRSKGHLWIGAKQSWSRIEELPGAADWENPPTITEDYIDVEMDTIDNILEEINMPPEQISLIKLTVNGAEYESLRGMTNTLNKNPNLALVVACGRQNEGHGEGDIGYIDGQPDYLVISNFLSNYGFRVEFIRSRPNIFGFLFATKGNKHAYF
jgi:FkbM family methyltransferase